MADSGIVYVGMGAKRAQAPAPDPSKVFVVHGRNEVARRSMFDFLRAIGLRPIEWDEAIAATGSASPFIGQVLDTAFSMAQAIVVLMTPDEVAHLLPTHAFGANDPDALPGPQARPNVLFEAGMAIGRNPDRTLLVELGPLRPFSDIAGRHVVRLTNDFAKRNALAQRLKSAGCDVNLSGPDWATTGDFSAPAVDLIPPPVTFAADGSPSIRRGKILDGYYLDGGMRDSQIVITNLIDETVVDLVAENERDFPGSIHSFPIRKIPGGKDKRLSVLKYGSDEDEFDLIIVGRTESGEEIREEIFLDFNG